MDNTLVSARVPRAKKERGCGVLASIGATTSDLINSAFDYVIANKELPRTAAQVPARPGGFHDFVRESTLDIDWPEHFDGDYKALAASMRIDDYEALARH